MLSRGAPSPGLGPAACCATRGFKRRRLSASDRTDGVPAWQCAHRLHSVHHDVSRRASRCFAAHQVHFSLSLSWCRQARHGRLVRPEAAAVAAPAACRSVSRQAVVPGGRPAPEFHHFINRHCNTNNFTSLSHLRSGPPSVDNQLSEQDSDWYCTESRLHGVKAARNQGCTLLKWV